MKLQDNVRSPAGEDVRSLWTRTSPLRGLLLVVAIEIAVSLSFIYYFCSSFNVSKRLMMVHSPLASGLFFAGFLPAALFVRFAPQTKSIRYLLMAVPGLVFSLLLILYASDYATNAWMGGNVTYKITKLFFSDLLSGGNLLPLSPRVYFSLAAFVLMIVAAHLALAGKISNGLAELVLPGRDLSLFKHRRRAIKSGVVVVVLGFVLGGYVYQVYRRAPYSRLLSSDPLVSFFRSTTEVYDESYPLFVGKLAEEEQLCRERYPRNQKFEKKNVIVLIVDSLRADHTQLYGYDRPTTPFLASLFASGHLRKVELATSICSESNCGILSTLFSKPLGRQIVGDFKLYDLLHDQGYKTYFVLSGSHDWLGLREKYGHEMDFYFDGRDSKVFSKADDRLIFEGLDKVPAHRDFPAFFYIHLMSAHKLGFKQDEYRKFEPTAPQPDWEALMRGKFDRPAVVNEYDNGIVQADDEIRKIFEVLRKKSYLDDSLVVILADHGEGLGERGDYGHVKALYSEYIHIPLLFYDEGSTKYENLKFANQLDVAPTVIDRLGLAPVPCWQGSSLLSPKIRSFSTHQTLLGEPCFAVEYRTEAKTYQYLSCRNREELYELNGDPTERINLIDVADRSLIDLMREQLAQSRDSFGWLARLREEQQAAAKSKP